MGIMHFLVHSDVFPDGWEGYNCGYFSGFDGRVFPTQVKLQDNVLYCERHVSDSGKFHVRWPVPGFGQPVLTTSTLCEREQPYLLPVELARGKVCQVRNQLAIWQRMGMTVPDSAREVLQRSVHRFCASVSVEGDEAKASAFACEALVTAMEAAELLTRAYCDQRIAIRRGRSVRLPASLGCSLGTAVPSADWGEPFCQAFNAAAVPVSWRDVEQNEGECVWDNFDAQVEWCQQNRLLIHGGPLLDFSEGGLPTWLHQWKNDVLNLQSLLCDYVETAVSRYVGQIRTWEVDSRVNTGGALGLSEEDRIALVARTLRVARQVDEEAQLYVGVVQPWGDYLGTGRHRFAPIDFVDALMRFGVGLTGVNLEISIGYDRYGAPPRDLLDFSRLIDLWSGLEIPLQITLAFPSSSQPDSNATSGIGIGPDGWKSPWSEQAQAEWVDLYLPLLLAKQSVVGVYWTHFSDQFPHELPNAGLVHTDGTSKAALSRIIEHHSMWK